MYVQVIILTIYYNCYCNHILSNSSLVPLFNSMVYTLKLWRKFECKKGEKSLTIKIPAQSAIFPSF